jgi:hypothetical protein
MNLTSSRSSNVAHPKLQCALVDSAPGGIIYDFLDSGKDNKTASNTEAVFAYSNEVLR